MGGEAQNKASSTAFDLPLPKRSALTTATPEPPIRVFLSYSHADDIVLEFIDPFVSSLKHMAFVDQGRQLDIFIDRQSIGWGDDWQTEIRSGIDSAMVFMPVVTRQYFDRPACREELLTFYSEAKALGVTSLLLPVVILGHSYISAESQDIAARIISERQYRDLKSVWIAGPQSETWRAAIVQLASELVDAAIAAESSLTNSPSPCGALTAPVGGDDDTPGSTEVAEALDHFGDKSQSIIVSLTGLLAEVPSIIPSVRMLQGMEPAAVRQALLEVAALLRPLGTGFEAGGREFESLAMNTDEIMRSYVRYLRENSMDEVIAREREALVGAEQVMAELIESESVVVEFLDQIRPLEVISAPMRNSIRGFREGGKAVRSGIAIMRSWPRILDEG